MPVPLKTRILLADDHELVRGGLKLVLDSQPDLSVVAEAGDGATALEIGMTRRHRPCRARRIDAAPDRAPDCP